MLKPEELTAAEELMLRNFGGMDEHESPIKSFHATVIDCMYAKQKMQAYRPYELFFFARRHSGVCTGLAMLARSKHDGAGERLRTRGIQYELHRLASTGGKGSGARLHWHLCHALRGKAADAGWRDGQGPLTVVHTLMSCTVRAGGFYLKMGWEYDTGDRQGGRKPTGRDIGKIMRLDLADVAAWSGYADRRAADRTLGAGADGATAPSMHSTALALGAAANGAAARTPFAQG